MPRVFVFELDPVIEVRKRAEREHMGRVARLERERVMLLERVREVQQNMAGARASLGELLSGGPSQEAVGGTRVSAVNMHAVRMQAHASLHGVIALQRAALELAGLTRRVEAARAELLKAAVARKAVEKLRERRFALWKREQAVLEAMDMDDLAVMRASQTQRRRGDEFNGEASGDASRTMTQSHGSTTARRGPMEVASLSAERAGRSDATQEGNDEDGVDGGRSDGART